MFQKVRKQRFEHREKIQGKYINILEGHELHTDVFSESEQRGIVDYVFYLRDLGRAGRLRKRTYSEPQKWMRGKRRITIQCGCCYNFTYDNEGNPPGIIRHDEMALIPTIIKRMIQKMVLWHVLSANCVPNSCIINIYEKGDCIPPHIDHHDFLRPSSTISFISECNILFGSDLQTIGPGEFRGSAEIPLPLGSVLVLKGNGADLVRHCIPGVPRRRVSITFRKMDDSKAPFGYRPDPDLEGLRPLEL
ncbi:RNA demethylase ALKBH5-like [Phalaenopsis equestris]|uniref:RNA demethylase ALKBH5-like n=1 Tax=Phalaenopsis equestris TaxID=78828 RepID=UPI0009E233B2|nr:RNA demethylase ALKBH5-like [Phalaenopsis equestris]